MLYRTALFFVVVALWAGGAAPAAAQEWRMVDIEGTGGAGASVCATSSANDADPPCFRLTCEDDTPLHYEIALFDAAATEQPAQVAVEVRVDGQAAGLLLFETAGAADGVTDLVAPFDPRLHLPLVAKLRRGNRAELVIQNPAGAITAPISLRGSSKALGAVLETCPMPEVPLNDPAAAVLDEIVRQCGSLGGSVAMEPGFERREDLDGDGRDDVVIDYAAAVCSEMASLYCGSGGCTVGFFLARDDGYERIFAGVIRGYTAKAGGLLALDLHGTACGLYGFEACRKIFRIADGSFALIEEIAGSAAEAAQAADRAEAESPDEGTAPPAPDAPVEERAVTEPAPAPETLTVPPAATPGADRGAPGTEAAPPAPTAPLASADKSGGSKAKGKPPSAGIEPSSQSDAAPEPQTPQTAPERDPPTDPSAPAAVAPAAPLAQKPPGNEGGLEWIGDGGPVFIPTEGESLPDDLLVVDPDPAGPDGT